MVTSTAMSCPLNLHILPCSCAAPPPEGSTAQYTEPVGAVDAALIVRDALLEGRKADATKVLHESNAAALVATAIAGPEGAAQEAMAELEDQLAEDDFRAIAEALAPASAELASLLSDPDTQILLSLAPSLLAEFEVMLCRRSLADFIQAGWHVIEPATKLEWNWHHQLICDVVQGMFEDWLRARDDETFQQRVLNALLNVPPGSLKSRILAVFFPVWCWLHEPGFKIICLSVNQEASFRDGRASRELIRSDWFQSRFKPQWRLRDDQDSISNYGNTAGGERISRAQASEIVGLRADCFTGETLVATERGNMRIDDLHVLASDQRPRVWSVDHDTGVVELRSIQASRRIDHRPVIQVRTQSGNALRCTRDHRFWTGNDYTQAAHLAGSRVPVVRTTELDVAGSSDALQSLLDVDTGLLGLPRRVPARRNRAREVAGALPWRTDSVLTEVRGRGEAPTRRTGRHREELRMVHGRVPTWFDEGLANVLLDEVSRGIPASIEHRDQDLRVRGGDACEASVSSAILHEGVRESRAFAAYGRSGELELLGSPAEPLRGRTLGESAGTDSRAGRVSLCRVSDDCEQPRDAGASHRPRPEAQLAGESDHTLRRLPHDSSQGTASARVLVDEELGDGCVAEDAVYDIQVEGLHNFLVGGVRGEYLVAHNCLIIDDPNNPKEAESANERDYVNDLWDTNIYNRVNDPRRSMRIGVQQRTHELDWSGHVLSKQGAWRAPGTNGPDDDGNRLGWLHVVIPAEFEESRRCVTPWGSDPRTREGQSIHPRRVTPEFLQKERERFGADKYAGQMQQRPTAATGGRIQKAFWGYCRLSDLGVSAWPEWPMAQGDWVTDRPRPAGTNQESKAHVIHPGIHRQGWDLDWLVISIDAANKKTVRGSNYGILVVGGKGQRRFVLDDKTTKGEITEILRVLRKLILRWRPDRILIEDKAAGPSILAMLREELADGTLRDSNGRSVGVVLEAIPANGEFEARVDGILPILEAGHVYLLDGASWLEDFVDELSRYPLGARDDRVDALSQVLTHMRDTMAGVPRLPDW